MKRFQARNFLAFHAEPRRWLTCVGSRTGSAGTLAGLWRVTVVPARMPALPVVHAGLLPEASAAAPSARSEVGTAILAFSIWPFALI